MKSFIFTTLIIFSSLASGLLPGLTQASEKNQSELKHGKQVHENHCLKCHTDSIYTRENRIVKSINALGKQVRICRDNTEAPWFAEDTDAVINFLNNKYYRF